MSKNVIYITLLLFVHRSNTEATSSLTVEDKNILDQTARYGLISLSDTRSANYTFNLTGVLLLGLVVSAATTYWTFLNVHLNKNRKDSEYDSAYGGNYRRKRSVTESMLEKVIFTIRELEKKVKETRLYKKRENKINEGCCLEKLVCMSPLTHNKIELGTFGSEVNKSFRVFELYLQKYVENDLTHSPLNRLFGAWMKGRYKEECDSDLKHKCSMSDEELLSILRESFSNRSSASDNSVLEEKFLMQ
ncbi:uncharacterized protein LOC136041840 [Artemia franciscana]|uniref:uncharacterized protein LOC136041840 n=1 Tax=Artemia franciscana TaxID=6661 RepID=UPI0032DB7AEC